MECSHVPLYQNLASAANVIKRDGICFLNGKVLLNPTFELVQLVLAECHSIPKRDILAITRHSQDFAMIYGGLACGQQLRIVFGRALYVNRKKKKSMSSIGLLQPLQIPKQIWTNMSIDFIERLSSSHDHMVIFIVVDRLSKYPHFISLTHFYMALKVTKVFVDHVV